MRLDVKTFRPFQLAVGFGCVLAAIGPACGPGRGSPVADAEDGEDSVDPTTSDDESFDESTSTSGEDDAICESPGCACEAGDERVVRLSRGHTGSRCAIFADGSSSCWGWYLSALADQDGTRWWPYDAFGLPKSDCDLLAVGNYPRVVVAGGFLDAATTPEGIFGLLAEHRVSGVVGQGWTGALPAGVQQIDPGAGFFSWPEGSIAPEGSFVELVSDWFEGHGRGCARTASGGVCCWGPSHNGEAILGLPAWPAGAVWPLDAGEGACWLDLGAPAKGLHVSLDHTCLWDVEGELRCWGTGNHRGILGYGHSEPVGAGLTPAQMAPVPVQGKVVAAEPPCAVLEDGRLTCWSWAAQWLGQSLALPDDVGADQAPVVAVGFAAIGVAVREPSESAGVGPTICAWSADGRGKCWGGGGGVQGSHATCLHGGAPPCADLGDDEPIAGLPELAFGSPIRQIVAGTAILVRLEDGRVQCWGSKQECPLEVGEHPSFTPPVAASELPALDFHCDCAE